MTIASQIIDAFGGTTKLARLLSASTSTVHSWRTIGIPPSRMAHLELVAQRDGIELPHESKAA